MALHINNGMSREDEIIFLYKHGIPFDKLVLDLLYDREFCKARGINYCDIRGKDVANVRNHVYWVLTNIGGVEAKAMEEK